MQRIHKRESHDAIEIYLTTLESKILSDELVIQLLIRQQNMKMRTSTAHFGIIEKQRSYQTCKHHILRSGVQYL